MTDGPPPAVVTLSATYGSGGSRIGPLLAEALGVPFVDRAITTRLAERLSMPEQEVAARDDTGPSRLDQMFASLAAIAGMSGAEVPQVCDDRTFVRATESIVRATAERTGGVILGRAAAVVLADHPRALHVRLDGPLERRVVSAAEIDGVDREAAEQRARVNDAARERYVRSFYGADPGDAALYHVVLDTTRIPHDVCISMLAAAARAAVAVV